VETEVLEQLKRDILDVLPDDHGYILIALPIGIPAAPTYLSNMERTDAIYVMRKILGVLEPVEIRDNGT
jgi:hypothetical protein